ncbi:hypothetical protein Micbo1qcDRAFT_154889 [Microdochium bolleyi]|uniref:Nudix hydrolase domain-containing protein n=1 Tax=Microdochium bolleyi TaxID=196109 RepID=A0A136JGT1_9PEZI|nr:hypothetical protein Micbo1qcDRAFT_154889 [Microdochium bolleyi]
MSLVATQSGALESPLRDVAHLAPPVHLDKYMISPTDFIRQSQGQVHRLVAAVIVMHIDSSSGTPKTLLIQRSRHDYMGLCWEIAGGSCEDDDHSILVAAARELEEEAGLWVSNMIDVVEDDHEWLDQGKVWRKMTFLAEAVAVKWEVPMEYALDNANSKSNSTAMATSNGVAAATDMATNTLERPMKNAASDQTDQSQNGNGSCLSRQSITGNGTKPKDFPIVTLDPNEHEDFVWASEAEVMAGLCEGRTLVWTTKEQQLAILRAFEMIRSCGRL